MAKILDQEEQRKALRNINDSIKDIKSANEFLRNQNPNGVYVISFTGEDGKKYSAEIKVADKEEVNRLIISHKQQEKLRIVQLAEDNRIALDEEDNEVLACPEI